MAEPHSYALSSRLSQLIGRTVTFVETTAEPGTNTKQVYGVYTVLPHETAIIVQADLPLLGSFAGALLGFPDCVVREHLQLSQIEEVLRDAIHEVLNITSAAITNEGRAVFIKMVTDPAYIDGAAGGVFARPDRRTNFNVAVDGYQGGMFREII
jgi:hypothetical protein